MIAINLAEPNLDWNFNFPLYRTVFIVILFIYFVIIIN